MGDGGQTIPTMSRLRYKKGEQICKQNDFGVSIYKILSGRVLIFRECEGLEVPIAELGKGDIIGEMVFFLKATEVRSASARAARPSAHALEPGFMRVSILGITQPTQFFGCGTGCNTPQMHVHDKGRHPLVSS